MFKNLKLKIILLLIIAIGAFFRMYGLNWDQGYHLHPDERAIVMFTTPLQFPKTTADFFSIQSTWNPHFFAYGSFPIYLLKIIGNIASIVDPAYSTYDEINLLGRFLSAIFDIGTLVVLFFLAKKLFNQKIGLLSSFFYAISVLPIQLSHFYAVDTLLTFFVLLTIFTLIHFYEHPTKIKAVCIGIFFGLSLATKTSALVLIASIGMAVTIDFILIFIKQPHKPHIWFPHLPNFLKRLFIDITIIMVTTVITFIIFEPYALIDFKTFWQQQLQQRQMTYDAFTFPYTLQYVSKIPYWYELKNIFFWGLGPILATLSLLGTIYVTIKQSNKKIIILLTFFWVYFLIVGNFAIGFMRYMLPLYPLLCLFSASIAYQLLLFLKRKLKYWYVLIVLVCIGNIMFWPLSFMHIYTRPSTRILASEWINQNIPVGSTIATEHWDDGLPLNTQSNYKVLNLPMYESDTPAKWDKINKVLQETEYIIIASNRLYVPLMKMIDCQKLPPGRCYTQTTEYYKKLFSGQNVILNSFQDLNRTEIPKQVRNDTKEVRFQKVAEFSVYPQLSILNFQLSINDSSADESFTVYDHPKVMIFKKI